MQSTGWRRRKPIAAIGCLPPTGAQRIPRGIDLHRGAIDLANERLAETSASLEELKLLSRGVGRALERDSVERAAIVSRRQELQLTIER